MFAIIKDVMIKDVISGFTEEVDGKNKSDKR